MSYDETSPDCGRNLGGEIDGMISLDPTALNHVFDLVDRLRTAGGYISGQFKWYDEDCPSNSVSLCHNPSQVLADRNALENALRTKDILTSSADALLKIQDLIVRRLKTCEEDIEVYKRRGGFFVIPDEILSLVLEFAALDEEGGPMASRKTVKSAIKLSHVCKRFRDLTTCSPILWKNVYNWTGNVHIVSLCLSRCKNRHNAEVTLLNHLFGGLDNTSFIFAMLEDDENVESFVLEGDLEEQFPLHEFGLEDQVEDEHWRPDDYYVLSYPFHMLHLKRMSIHYPRSAMSTEKLGNADTRNAMNFYTSWTTPRLRSFSARQFIPVPFSGTRSLTSLKIELGSDHRRGNTSFVGLDLDIKSLVVFLLACCNLQEIELDIQEANNILSLPAYGSCAEMQHVTNLNLDLVYCRGSVIKALFDALRFPSVMTMKLHMNTLEEDEAPDEHFTDIFRAVIPDANAFPNLIEMDLQVWARQFRGRDRKYQHGTISIPFDAIPKLRTLKLNTALSFVSPIPETMQLPPIRTLELVFCVRITKSWVGSILRQAKEQGGLDDVQVTVQRCTSEEEEDGGFHGILTKEVIREIAEL